MKSKFGLMWRVGLALVLALSLSLVMAVPVAADVSQPTVAVDPPLAGVAAEYTIGFDINTSLATGGTITVVFHTGTTVPATYAAGDITVQGANVSASGTGDTVTIVLANAISAPGTVTVVFTTAADIVNPTAGDKTLTVATSAEPNAVTSETYTILALPAVTGLAPIKGNVGDTMWVEVTGTGFTGDDETNASTTTLDFGGGITVVSTKYVLATSIDVEITITAPGAVSVAATTAAGTGTGIFAFTANDADTAQVDVWTKYTPDTDTIFDSETLVFDATTDTIADGIAAAGAGTLGDPQVLIVHAATYAETLTVNQDYVTIESLSGADSTIIDGGSAVLIVSVTHLSVTLDGFTIQGDATTTNQAGILVNGGTVSGFAIQNNKFVDIANDNLKVWSTAGAITSGTIDNNTLTGLGSDAQRACILVESDGTNAIADVTITDNTISNFLGVDTCEWPGIQVAEEDTGAISNITITGNNISNGATGIKLAGDIAGLTGNYAVADNTISGMFEAGVSVASGSPVFDLENNTITDCRYGIELWQSGADHTIKYNDISGNSWGLLAPSTTGVITAKYNWWGDISGPSSGSELTPVFTWWSDKVSTALGSGDAMSINVTTWDPWLTRSQATAITDGIAYHGSTYPLDAGWNTLSVPLALDDGADTMADIVALGDFIISDPTDLNKNYLGGYYYDAVNGLWVELPGAYEFAPCKAVYVKMAADASFPVLYSGVFSLPSLSLPAGWNLIGSAFGIDKDDGSEGNLLDVGDYGVATADADGDGYPVDADLEAEKALADALSSIATNCAVVVSPSMPGQLVAWGDVITGSSQKMYVGEGYWVFMTAPATLAGFEVTPIYWIAP